MSAPRSNTYSAPRRARGRRPRSRPSPWRSIGPAARRRQRRAPRPGAAIRPPLGSRLRRVFWSWWPWAALAAASTVFDRWIAAAATGAMALFCYLIAPRSQPPRLGLDHEFDSASPEFLATMVGATGGPLVAGNRFEVLNNGDAFYPRMLADIQSATVSITVEAYIYWAGEIGLAFAKALAERASHGVRVMALLDAVGSADIGDDILATLEGGGCEVAWYNPIDWKTIGRFNNRTHRKSLVLDGAVAYTGGAGIADHWRGNARDASEWRDIQVRIAGPAAAGLQTGFAHNWQQTTGELLSGDAFYPVVPAAGPLPLQVILSSPETGGSNVQTMYYLAIVCARRSIRIANPYFVPDDVAIDALVDARRRGVDVQVLVAGIHNDNWLARKNSVRLYGALLDAGIRLYEYDRSMLHHKLMVVDGRWATIGTTNFDNRSFAHNEESNVCLFDAEVAADLEALFDADVVISQAVTPEAWRRRGWSERLAESLASLLEDQV